MSTAMRLVPLLAGALGILTLAGPASAQVDVAGEWAERLHEDRVGRLLGPMLSDFAGFPLTDAARLGADAWDSSILSVKEHQAHQYSAVLSFHAPFGKRIAKVVDPRSQAVVAYEVTFGVGLATRTIWMDGRPHPPEFAPHTWGGYSTGRWDGRALVVTTTHMKAGYLTRNGVRHSDRATMTEHFVRHGNVLTVFAWIDDPQFLEEPYVQTWTLTLDPDQRLAPVGDITVFEEVGSQRRGYVPHYLPGQNPYLREYAELSGLPFHATRGGAQTMYPEYAAQLRGVQTKLIKEAAADAAARLGSASSSRSVAAP